jgi:hypothetical protein
MKFCPVCHHAPFCSAACTATTARIRYAQRSAWCASVMLATAMNDEQHRHYSTKLAEALNALQQQGETSWQETNLANTLT